MSSSMTISAAFAFFVCFLIAITTFHACFCDGDNSSSDNNHNIPCFEIEREALVKFRQDLKGLSNRLSSWDIGEDCCQWVGVVCDNFTGHVNEIHLHYPPPYNNPQNYEFESYIDFEDPWYRNRLRGKLNPSLLDLKHLQYLDLSNNDFEGTPIPSFIGSFATLRYLNLSRANFSGTIPPQLGNVTTMRYLDLEGNLDHGDNCQLRGGNLQWLSGLDSLQHLDMSFVNLSEATDWLQVTSNLPSLVELHLSNCELEHVISPSSTSKINFTSLDILDLSENHLESIPGLIRNMTSLRVLDWSSNFIDSTIPNWLYSLSHLESLSLSGNRLQGAVSIAIENLTSLVSLDLSFNKLQGSIPTSLGKLCKLKTIDLDDNKFSGEIADIFIGFSRCKFHELETFSSFANHLFGHLPNELGQLKSLAHFDLSHNSFSGPVPVSMGGLSSLIELDLSYNSFSGPVPVSMGGLSSLIKLDLSDNSFSGPIPVSIGGLSSLTRFDLSYNKLNGTLPESLGQLAKLETLCIEDNSLEGVISDVHFANLTRLHALLVGGNNLALKATENWIPPFQVRTLSLDSWQLGPQFPLWLSSQRELIYLNIANSNISDSIPKWFWPIFSKLQLANLSHNHIPGEISSFPDLDQRDSLDQSGSRIDLSSNRFRGSLPLVPPNLTWLDLSNNSFSGSMYHMLCRRGKEANNQLYFLNLGNNRLSGKIPDCWKHWLYLTIIKLENNNLAGSIPSSIGQLPQLKSLHLRHNNLSGELPKTLQNCSSLLIIDFSENKLSGSIPPWMGNASLGLIVLNLRSNNFWGDLPYELCRLSFLQILDVAHNNLFGPLPRCFANFSVMAKISNSSYSEYWYSQLSGMGYVFEFLDHAALVTKGRDVEYSTTLQLVTSIDLSGNNLSGEIPDELTKLVGLWSLNLSGNHLTGRIPRSIGDMRLLESLDFSLNQLSGIIPPSMSSLTFLSHLNLSYNNLTGSIPTSTQLQSLNESSFLGNKLCGPPLASCNPNTEIPPKVQPGGSEEEEGEGFLEALFFASMAMGFAFGFWIVMSPLLFKRSWRIAYFRVVEDIWYKLCKFGVKCCYMLHHR